MFNVSYFFIDLSQWWNSETIARARAYLCECNSKLLSHELFLIIHGYDQRVSKLDLRNKGFMFTIKEVWDRVCSPENQFFNINSCEWPSTSCLKSFTWFWQVLDESLSIYFFIPASTCPAHDVTNFIVFDWFWQLLFALLIWNYSSSNPYNSGTRREIKKR